MINEAITVGELKIHLAGLSDSDEICLPGNLTFYRIKQRGENLHCIEVNEPVAYLTDEFKKRNPHLKVAFISADNVKWDESGIIGDPIDVELF